MMAKSSASKAVCSLGTCWSLCTGLGSGRAGMQIRRELDKGWHLWVFDLVQSCDLGHRTPAFLWSQRLGKPWTTEYNTAALHAQYTLGQRESATLAVHRPVSVAHGQIGVLLSGPISKVAWPDISSRAGGRGPSRWLGQVESVDVVAGVQCAHCGGDEGVVCGALHAQMDAVGTQLLSGSQGHQREKYSGLL
ncbi:MAG: hypothetical protein ACI9VR_001541 [Cognaticolwellia sp.]|jgi:hypothetical protein